MRLTGRCAPLALMLALALASLLTGCGGGGASGPKIIVTSLEDPASPPAGVVTLRAALDQAPDGAAIAFAPSLNGGTIRLQQVGNEHSLLPGEVYTGMTFSGYQDRDYGRSALYAHKSVNIDASALPNGITLKWDGGDALPARVLAVYGNLTLNNITVTGGHSVGVATGNAAQPYTLARGGGLAVWGQARLRGCTVWGNRITGDVAASRDRGTYGAGIYANGLDLDRCTISGNSGVGYGVAGGGIYSVGGADRTGGRGADTLINRCAITGNRITAQHCYGGGVFTLSGGPANVAMMTITNSTIACNVVEDNPDLPQAGQFYYRGGGIYMGGGSLEVRNCTIARNSVSGTAAVFSNKPNIGGGGVAATIGNAHVVENVIVAQSIVVGNTLNGEAEDWFTGSILGFYSGGYNRIGRIDFSQILVPVPDWTDLSRKHYPKAGDQDGLDAAGVLDLAGAHRHATAISAGVDAGQPAIDWIPPTGAALDVVPRGKYTVQSARAGYTGFGVATDDFLNQVLAQVRVVYAAQLGTGFGSDYGDLKGTTWYGPSQTWPSDPADAPWIAFWRGLDTRIGDRLGQAGLADDFWQRFPGGAVGNETVTVLSESASYALPSDDQRGIPRNVSSRGDAGAIER